MRFDPYSGRRYRVSVALNPHGTKEFKVRIRTAGDAFFRFIGLRPSDLIRSSLPPHMGKLFQFFFNRSFSRVRINSEDIQNIHAAHRHGHPVYMLSYRSILDVLYLSYRLEKEGLGSIYLAPELDGIWLQPMGRALRIILGRMIFWVSHGRKPHPIDDGIFLKALEEQKTIVLFLRQSDSSGEEDRKWAGHKRFHNEEGHGPAIQEYLAFLFRCQERLPKPIMIIPHVPIWETNMVRLRKNWIDVLFGTRLQPRLIRRAFQILWHRGLRAQVYFPTPIDLREFQKQRHNKSSRILIKELRWKLNQRFEQKQFVVRGPKLLPRDHLIRSILHDPGVRNAALRISAKRRKNQAYGEQLARKYLKEMTGDYQRWTIKFFEGVLEYVLKHNCDGLVYDVDRLNALRKVMAKGTIVFLPNHRSHLDYFLISYILFRNKIVTPFICAGDNLNFWPAGPFFRRAGAFFIRRTFSETTLYPVVLRRYLRSLMRGRVPQELFIEGGRSRTGKMRPPMLGIFNLMLKAYFQGAAKDLFLVPISLSYERVPEEMSYVREMCGETKRLEGARDIWRLFQMRKEKIGKVYMSVGDPISCNDYIEEHGLDLSSAKEFMKRKAGSRLAKEISNQIEQGIILPASGILAMILMSLIPEENGKISWQSALGYAEMLLSILDQHEDTERIRAFHVLEPFQEGLAKARNQFESAGLISWDERESVIRVLSDDSRKKFMLDYYRNSVLHCYVSHCIVASAVFSFGQPESRSTILGRCEEIQNVLHHDFPVGGGVSCESALRDLQTWRMLSSDDPIRVLRDSRLNLRRLLKFRHSILEVLKAHYWTAEFGLHWIQGKIPELDNECQESDLIRWILSKIESQKSENLPSWFNIVNALASLADLKMVSVRTKRRGKKVFRVFSHPKDIDFQKYDDRLHFIYELCFLLKNTESI